MKHSRTIKAVVWQDIVVLSGPGHFLNVGSVCKQFWAWYTRRHGKKQKVPMPLTLDMCKWMHAMGHPNILMAAARAGLLAGMQFAVQQGAQCAVLNTSQVGTMDFSRLDWFMDDTDMTGIFDNNDVAHAAAEGGNFECLQYAVQQGAVCDMCTAQTAAIGGHLDCLQYICTDGGVECYFGVILAAARGGNLGCLQYAVQKGAKCDEWVTDSAACGGHLDCLQFAVQQGAVCDGSSAYSAAQGGYLDCLQLVVQQGAKCDKLTAQAAAENGHLECLRLIVQQGAECDGDVTHAAAKNGHQACLDYLLQQGVEFDSEAMQAAASSEDFDGMEL